MAFTTTTMPTKARFLLFLISMLHRASTLVYKYNFYFNHFLNANTDDLNGLGVVHADDLFMLFNSKMTPPLTPDDTKASKILIDLWTSFATDGYNHLIFLSFRTF